MIPVKDFIDQPLRTNVFHVHFEARTPEQRDMQLGALPGMETTLYAVVHEGHETCRNNNTT
jgi:hypothetical protein